jgi:hypothetical protein
LGSGELLFQVTVDGLLLLPSEGGGALVCPCLVQGPVCGSYDSDESLLLLVHGRGDGLSHAVILLRLGDSGGGLLPINGGEVEVAARHGHQDNDG